MSEKIVVPALGESITEATVAKWLKNTGDSIEADEPIVELETDKVNLEVPSPINGVLGKISASEGDVVQVGSTLGLINSNSKGHSGNNLKDKSEDKEENNIVSIDIEKKKEQKEIKIFQEAQETVTEPESSIEEKPLVLEAQEQESPIEEKPLVLTNEVEEKTEANENLSPAVRKIVAENKIDVKKIKGSGKEGRILKEDLIGLMGVNPGPSERKIKYGHEERIKMTRLRQTIAKRLKQAQENAALLTTFNEVDMTNIVEMRKENQDDFQKRYGVKLGFMSFFIKASVVALKNFPAVNAEIEENEIVYKNYYNISFAVGTEKGLVVPVLRKADELSFADIEKNIKKLSDKAKDGKLTIEDLQGGTFTISNGGVYGSMLSTPILNLPQSGVLGMHNIVDRPIVVDGEIKIRPVMYLALSYDHRIIDGKDSVSFLKTIKENLEDPRRLFLNI
jgi:2-oxoglutarate dehydrogenase E2 component (dihydrolipoamide succinyltransferase)